MELLGFWILLAVVVGVAANSRGRSGLAWFLVAVIISPLIAGLLVLAIKRLNAPLPDMPLATEPTKVCPDCAERVRLDARICRFCRHEFGPAMAMATQPAPRR